jgi:hypothetical protein
MTPVATPPTLVDTLAIIAIPPAIPHPSAAKAPPPSAANDAFVSAAPESDEIAAPVVAVVPSNPRLPKYAAMAGAAKNPVVPTATDPTITPSAIFVGFFIRRQRSLSAALNLSFIRRFLSLFGSNRFNCTTNVERP